jgi:hypothetical protein
MRKSTKAVTGLESFAPDRFEDGRLDPRYSLDPGIRHFVLILRSQGIETCQSCQGGPGIATLSRRQNLWAVRATVRAL